jgi:hypothetical protein
MRNLVDVSGAILGNITNEITIKPHFIFSDWHFLR